MFPTRVFYSFYLYGWANSSRVVSLDGLAKPGFAGFASKALRRSRQVQPPYPLIRLYSSTVELGTVNTEIDVRLILRANDSYIVYVCYASFVYFLLKWLSDFVAILDLY